MSVVPSGAVINTASNCTLTPVNFSNQAVILLAFQSPTMVESCGTTTRNVLLPSPNGFRSVIRGPM